MTDDSNCIRRRLLDRLLTAVVMKMLTKTTTWVRLKIDFKSFVDFDFDRNVVDCNRTDCNQTDFDIRHNSDAAADIDYCKHCSD